MVYTCCSNNAAIRLSASAASDWAARSKPPPAALLVELHSIVVDANREAWPSAGIPLFLAFVVDFLGVSKPTVGSDLPLT